MATLEVLDLLDPKGRKGKLEALDCKDQLDLLEQVDFKVLKVTLAILDLQDQLEILGPWDLLDYQDQKEKLVKTLGSLDLLVNKGQRETLGLLDPLDYREILDLPDHREMLDFKV